MKTLVIAVSALLIAGCQSSRTNTPITAEQATARCVELANGKAESVYHHRPFESKKPATFEDGRWVWTDLHGVGTFDFHARVEVAADGSTNNVDVRMTDAALHPEPVRPITPFSEPPPR